MLSRTRRWRARAQGLDGSLIGASAHDALCKAGWIRSVGGANPYLALAARTGLTPSAINKALAEREIQELPSARGCTYLIPKAHFGIALSLSQGTVDEAPLKMAIRHLGVTESEIEILKEAILDAMHDEPLTINEIKAAVGDKIRNLGEAGKKKGTTTTLALALMPLQTHGKIVRVPSTGNLLTQTFAYQKWHDAPEIVPRVEAESALAELFCCWTGGATEEEFGWFSGLAKGKAKKLLETEQVSTALGFMTRDDADQYDAFDFEAMGEERFLGGMDNLNHLRQKVGDLLDPRNADRMAFTDKGSEPMGMLKELWSNMIVRDGDLVGVWEFDPTTERVVTQMWETPSPRFEANLASLEAMIHADLGDCRMYSMDTGATRVKRVDALRRSSSGS